MRRAAERMDETRRRIGRVEGWSSTEVIREWRERRRPSEVIKRQAGEHGELKGHADSEVLGHGPANSNSTKKGRGQEATRQA